MFVPRGIEVPKRAIKPGELLHACIRSPPICISHARIAMGRRRAGTDAAGGNVAFRAANNAAAAAVAAPRLMMAAAAAAAARFSPLLSLSQI